MAASDLRLVKTTLPLAMKVRTVPKPSSSQISLRSLIGSLPVPPILTARSSATNEPMAASRA
jgi:hypothetical protein